MEEKILAQRDGKTVKGMVTSNHGKIRVEITG